MKDGVVVGTTPLYIIGVDAGKERIYSDLIADKEQVHRFHFPKMKEEVMILIFQRTVVRENGLQSDCKRRCVEMGEAGGT